RTSATSTRSSGSWRRSAGGPTGASSTASTPTACARCTRASTTPWPCATRPTPRASSPTRTRTACSAARRARGPEERGRASVDRLGTVLAHGRPVRPDHDRQDVLGERVEAADRRLVVLLDEPGDLDAVDVPGDDAREEPEVHRVRDVAAVRDVLEEAARHRPGLLEVRVRDRAQRPAAHARGRELEGEEPHVAARCETAPQPLGRRVGELDDVAVDVEGRADG